MRIKILSDGSPTGTRLVDAESGEPVHGVTSIEWAHKAGELVYAVVEFHSLPVEIIVDVGPVFETTELGDSFRTYAMRAPVEVDGQI